MKPGEEEWLVELFQKKPGHMRLDLEAMSAAYSRLGFPLRNTPVVLVGGTNGKGSTGGMIACLLNNCGFKVGHYTSPHILAFEERIRVSGSETTLNCLKLNYQRVLAQLGEDFENLSFFEATTLLSFVVFQRANVDIAVVEVGLGGRLDATNILQPLVSAITSIDYDHTDWLGHRIEQIAEEKVCISREKRTLVLGQGVFKYEQAQQVIENLKGPKIVRPSRDYQVFADKIVFKSFGDLSVCFPSWLPNFSKVMRENYAVAFCVAVELQKAMKIDLDIDNFGLTALKYPTFLPASFSARGQVLLYSGFSIYLDVAHNPGSVLEAVSHFHQHFEGKKEKRVALLSLLADKDVSGILEVVKLQFSNIVFFKTESVRSCELNSIKCYLRDFDKVIYCRGFMEAFKFVRNNFDSEETALYIGGSFAAVSSFFEVYEQSLNSLRGIEA